MGGKANSWTDLPLDQQAESETIVSQDPADLVSHAYLAELAETLGLATMGTIFDTLEQSGPALLSAISSALAAGDEKAISENAHALKGAAASCGAPALAAAAGYLQKMPGASDVPQRVADLTALFNASVSALRAWRPA